MTTKLDVKISNRIKGSTTLMQNKLRNLPADAYRFFKNITPVRTGNAKRNTKLSGTTIEADYKYAQVLDKGRHMTNKGMRGSDQAPEGMTKPTEQYIQNRLKQIIKAK